MSAGSRPHTGPDLGARRPAMQDKARDESTPTARPRFSLNRSAPLPPLPLVLLDPMVGQVQ